MEPGHGRDAFIGAPCRERIAEYLDATTATPDHADLIFVPGTRLREPATIAAAFLERGVAPLVLVTGGINKATGTNEAHAHRSVLLSHGVSQDNILVEDTSTNTLENVLRGWEVAINSFSEQPLTSVVAVCKWMHSRRVLMTLKAHLPAGVRYYASTYAPEGVTREAWIQHGDDQSQPATVLPNWNNILVYLARGDIQEIVRQADGSWA